jgi:hypothetical protein
VPPSSARVPTAGLEAPPPSPRSMSSHFNDIPDMAVASQPIGVGLINSRHGYHPISSITVAQEGSLYIPVSSMREHLLHCEWVQEGEKIATLQAEVAQLQEQLLAAELAASALHADISGAPPDTSQCAYLHMSAINMCASCSCRNRVRMPIHVCTI